MEIRSTDSLKDIIKVLIANHMGSCPLDQQRGLFFIIITRVSAGKFENITRLQDVTVNFFLRRTAIISAIIFPNIILRIYWDANTIP